MRLSKRSKAFLCLMLVGGLAGCADYLNRRDTLAVGAGNAPEANTAIHTIDPFPPAASDTKIIVSY